MKSCDYCTHVEMCGWRKEVEEQGCEFFGDGIGWIPVSERLPGKNKEVLISCEWGMDIGQYDADGWRSEWINHYDDDSVLAWMPLPEPYKGGDTE